MIKILITLALLNCLNFSTAFADTGFERLTFHAAHQPREIEMGIVYPTEDGEGGTEIQLGENPVFYGAPVHEDATPKVGKFPIILLSHGWGGNFARMSWLSTGLASKGAIVVAVNHPNSTTGDTNDNKEALNHWTRAQDISAALDYVMKDPKFTANIDTARIYALGFSYGGWTALSLGGLRGQRDGLDKFCHDGLEISSHCKDILKAGIKISELDATKFDASYKDSRITAVAAIDPALTWGLTKENVKDLNVPVLLIGLGKGSDRLVATDTSSKGSNFEALFPAAKVEHLFPANHFTALGLCKPKGAAILEEEKDDPVCTDGKGEDRKAVMATIIDLIADHFNIHQK